MSAPTKSIIEELLEKPFCLRSLSEKRSIVKNGRPRPKLSNLKSAHKDSKKEYTRRFNDSQYTLYPWLAGCENTVKLYCWPCLLFSDITTTWNSTGIDNLNALQTLQKKHKQNVPHLQSAIKLAKFENDRVANEPGTKLVTLNSQHNLQVKKNREVLKRLIDVTCFLANQELPFGADDESAGSLNRGNYPELLNLLKLYDSTLAEHFQTSAAFKGTTMTIRNDLIQAVGELLYNQIWKQLEQTEFVAIMLDESSSGEQVKSQLSVVLRYYLNGKIRETFVGFIDVSGGGGGSVDDLLEQLKMILLKYDILQKLVAQTYDGAALVHVDGLQTKLADLCPKALFVKCYAHVLNVFLSQGLSNIRQCKAFFGTLNGIATFTSHFNTGTYGLQDFLKRQIPSLATVRWCFSSRLVEVVNTHRDLIVEYFDRIYKDDDNDNVWDINDRMAAYGYRKFLERFETVFLLIVFSKIFAESDVLFDTLQDENIEIVLCVNKINKFYSFLKDQREEGFPDVWRCALRTVQARRVWNDEFDSDETKYKTMFHEIVDNLTMQISVRLSPFKQLQYFDLLNGKNFNNYTIKCNFPRTLMQNLNESYKDIFDDGQLKNELMVLYTSREDILRNVTASSMEVDDTDVTSTKNVTAYDVLCYIENLNLATSFDQVYRLARLICTIPATNVTVGSTCPALDRIKAYVRNTRGQEMPGGLALLSIEKMLLTELRNSDHFYDQVIERFLTIEQRGDFMYK